MELDERLKYAAAKGLLIGVGKTVTDDILKFMEEETEKHKDDREFGQVLPFLVLQRVQALSKEHVDAALANMLMASFAEYMLKKSLLKHLEKEGLKVGENGVKLLGVDADGTIIGAAEEDEEPAAGEDEKPHVLQ